MSTPSTSGHLQFDMADIKKSARDTMFVALGAVLPYALSSWIPDLPAPVQPVATAVLIFGWRWVRSNAPMNTVPPPPAGS